MVDWQRIAEAMVKDLYAAADQNIIYQHTMYYWCSKSSESQKTATKYLAELLEKYFVEGFV